MRVLRSSQTAVHLVSLLEEMPVQETAEGINELVARQLPVGAVVVNMARPVLLPVDDAALLESLTDDVLSASLERADLEWLAGDPAALTGLRGEMTDHLVRVAMEQEERAKLVALDRPMLELPWLPDGVDLGSLYDLAEELVEQGVGQE